MSPQEYDHFLRAVGGCKDATAEKGWKKYAKLWEASERARTVDEYDKLAVEHISTQNVSRRGRKCWRDELRLFLSVGIIHGSCSERHWETKQASWHGSSLVTQNPSSCVPSSRN